MTNEQIFDYLRNTQGWMPELAGPGPDGHLEATEQAAAALPGVNTQAAQFEPQSLGPDLPLEMGGLRAASQQVPTPIPKPWQPVARKAGAVPQQAELIEMSKGETALRFADTSQNFQQAGLLVRQRSDALAKVAERVTEVGAAANGIVDIARERVQKAQRESGEWPERFIAFGAFRRCDSCNRAFWTVKTAWTHLQRGCPEKVRIERAMEEYQPCTMG